MFAGSRLLGDFEVYKKRLDGVGAGEEWSGKILSVELHRWVYKQRGLTCKGTGLQHG